MLTVALLSFGVVSAQTRTITGKVTNSKGEPVPSATIKKSKGEGTSTDENGNFKIQAQDQDVITISSINYGADKITVVAGKDAYTIKLAERINTMPAITGTVKQTAITPES